MTIARRTAIAAGTNKSWSWTGRHIEGEHRREKDAHRA